MKRLLALLSVLAMAAGCSGDRDVSVGPQDAVERNQTPVSSGRDDEDPSPGGVVSSAIDPGGTVPLGTLISRDAHEQLPFGDPLGLSEFLQALEAAGWSVYRSRDAGNVSLCEVPRIPGVVYNLEDATGEVAPIVSFTYSDTDELHLEWSVDAGRVATYRHRDTCERSRFLLLDAPRWFAIENLAIGLVSASHLRPTIQPLSPSAEADVLAVIRQFGVD